MTISEDTFAMQEEIENGDWSIDKLLTQQNEGLYERYQHLIQENSASAKWPEIFRGKASQERIRLVISEL